MPLLCASADCDLKFSPTPEEITYATQGLIWEPEFHESLEESDMCQALKRKYNRPNLLVYYHRQTCNFVIAEWIYRPWHPGPGLIIEVTAFTPDDPPSPAELDMMMRPGTEKAREVRANVWRMRKEKEEIDAETAVERQEAVKYLKKKGLEGEAAEMAMGVTPFCGVREGGDELAEIKSDLISGA